MAEKMIVAAPMSFAGSYQRLVPRASAADGLRGLKVAGAVILLFFWWIVILCWYIIFGILLVPYRTIRRGQRRKDALARAKIAALERKRPMEEQGQG
jgi:hypothetical protein